ncbi:GntR family transcriptional regulator [Glaciecola sp. KUL10]|uniref:GntR family transcriptional regulator n=1 Tax=Glaciecola sp. (strain KUL10) TaxID=2161813 RepID=UPI000D783844|nr:GntR family transcriptional regulator [Glaciecola sp. KUL10]GBL05293.1 GntR family transcriptional regulator [Glaciecola sp. KUL10]
MIRKKILSVREQIADELRSDIISGVLEPDTKLNEHALAERFGTSRGPIRDVLLKLTKEGLLVSRNNVGSSVASPLSPEIQKLSISIRRKIEEFAMKEISGKLTDEQLQQASMLIDEMQMHFDNEEFTELTKADMAFHQFLIEQAGGEDLVNMWYPITIKMRMNYKRINTSGKLVDEHRDILNAIKDGDAKGAINAVRKNIK